MVSIVNGNSMPTPAAQYVVLVLGDPIQDIYQYGYLSDTKPPRFSITNIENRYGGADNVRKNLSNLVNFDVQVNINSIGQQELYKLFRFTNPDTKEVYMLIPRHAPNPENHYYSAEKTLVSDCIGYQYTNLGLVISDYNKGCVNKDLQAKNLAKRFAFCIVDSRYGTYSRDYLDNCDFKVLHVMGKELEKHPDAYDLFDYILHTNGDGPVTITQVKNGVPSIIEILDVPDTKVVDTTGAGDTFVASIAASMANSYNTWWNEEQITSYVRLAIRRCQEVIQVFGATAVKRS